MLFVGAGATAAVLALVFLFLGPFHGGMTSGSAAGQPQGQGVSAAPSSPGSAEQPSRNASAPIPAGRLDGELMRIGDGWPVTVHWSPDGRRLIAVGTVGVLMYDASSMRLISSVETPDELALSSLSPDGKTLATVTWASATNLLQLWDVGSDKVVAVDRGYAAPWLDATRSIAFSADGKRVAIGGLDGSIHLWDVGGKKEVSGELPQGAKGWYLAYSPDGKTFAACDATSLRIWDLAERSLTRTIPAKTNEMGGSLLFSPDGKSIALSTPDDRLHRWDVQTGSELPTSLNGKTGTAIAFSPDSNQLAVEGADSGTVRILDTRRGVETSLLRTRGDPVQGLAFSPDGKSILIGTSTLQVLDLASGQIVGLVQSSSGFVRAIQFAADGRRLAVGSDEGRSGTIRVQDLSSNQELGAFPLGGPSGSSSWGLLSPDGKSVLTAPLYNGPSGGAFQTNIRFSDVGSGAAARQATVPYRIVDLTVSPTWKLIAAGEESGTVHLLDVADIQEVRRLQIGKSRVQSLAFSPDEKILAVGSDDQAGTVSTWDVATGAKIRQFAGGYGWAGEVVFSPDGRLVAVATDADVTIWDVAVGKRLRSLFPRGWAGIKVGLTFSPDGKTIASVLGNAIQLWDVSSGAEIGRLPGDSGGTFAVAYSPDGKSIATGGHSGVVRIWDPSRATPAPTPTASPTPSPTPTGTVPVTSTASPNGGSTQCYTVRSAEDSLKLVKVDPAPGTPLAPGSKVAVSAVFQYNLVSQDRAELSVMFSNDSAVRSFGSDVPVPKGSGQLEFRGELTVPSQPETTLDAIVAPPPDIYKAAGYNCYSSIAYVSIGKYPIR